MTIFDIYCILCSTSQTDCCFDHIILIICLNNLLNWTDPCSIFKYLHKKHNIVYSAPQGFALNMKYKNITKYANIYLCHTFQFWDEMVISPINLIYSK